MNRKRKAARAVNTATGLIVILVVILLSPLFGFGRGFASKEQRLAAAASQTAQPGSIVSVGPTSTPRPTAQPTQAPVVLPTAPPTPEPTPEPTHTPRPVVQQTVQQAPQQYWPQEEAWGEDEEYAEEEGGETGDDGSAGQEYDYSGLGEQPVENDSGNYVVETEHADIVFQGDDVAGSEYSYTPAESTTGETVTQPEPEVYTPVQQDTNEGEAFLIG